MLTVLITIWLEGEAEEAAERVFKEHMGSNLAEPEEQALGGSHEERTDKLPSLL